MKYGYARVSTVHQNLEVQLQQLKKENCDLIFSEKCTCANLNQAEFQKLLNLLQEGDTLVVTKLDRFARSTHNALEIIKGLFNRNIKVHVLNMGVIENTPNGRLIFKIFSAFAEFEKDMIILRTQEGKVLAKQKSDFREGRPTKFSKQQINHALSLLENYSYKQVKDLTGISVSTLVRAKKKVKAEKIITKNIRVEE
ncbi:resolvase [Niallia circulans]|jgi:DNA invertase Pin-like site-specific DNA recombinase|uniref:recombinase family protein n=1 Tax=Niallia circulans TaxID=1397 RepID=UPI000BA5700E|nr:recombinase family protein [Niallia circulans]PAD23513.1 resolvase [Niallia circulans]